MRGVYFTTAAYMSGDNIKVAAVTASAALCRHPIREFLIQRRRTRLNIVDPATTALGEGLILTMHILHSTSFIRLVIFLLDSAQCTRAKLSFWIVPMCPCTQHAAAFTRLTFDKFRAGTTRVRGPFIECPLATSILCKVTDDLAATTHLFPSEVELFRVSYVLVC